MRTKTPLICLRMIKVNSACRFSILIDATGLHFNWEICHRLPQLSVSHAVRSTRRKLMMIGCVSVTVCLILVVIVYWRIYIILKRHKNQIEGLQIQEVQQGVQNGDLSNFLKLRKSALGTFYACIVFLIWRNREESTVPRNATFRRETTKVNWIKWYLFYWKLSFRL